MYEEDSLKSAVYFGIEDEIKPAQELIYTAEMALKNIADSLKKTGDEQAALLIGKIKAVQSCIYTAYSKLDEFIEDPFCNE